MILCCISGRHLKRRCCLSARHVFTWSGLQIVLELLILAWSLCKRSAADPKNIPDLSGWMLLVVKYDSAPFFDPPTPAPLPPSTSPHLPLMLDVRLQCGVTSGWISHWSLCHQRAAAALTDSRGLRGFKHLICFSSGTQVFPEAAAAAALHHAESAGGGPGVAEQRMAAPGRCLLWTAMLQNTAVANCPYLWICICSARNGSIHKISLNSNFIPKTKGASSSSFFFLPHLLKISD